MATSQDNEKKRKQGEKINATVVVADTGSRYGGGVEVHVKSYSELKDYSSRKINPDYKDTNIKQQAGFSAEIKTVARENARKAINGDKTRAARTDDMSKQQSQSGEAVGGVNDPLYDIASLDENGRFIEGSGRQLKYVGKNAGECTRKLLSKDYDKYRESDGKIEVPKDFYDDVIRNLERREASLGRQIEHAQESGNKERVEKLKEQQERVKKTRQKLKRGELTNDEAIEARLHPRLSVAKDIVRTSAEAGLQGAEIAAAVNGTMSICHNIVEVLKGDKELDEAAKDVAKSAASAAAVGGASAFGGSVLSGTLRASKHTTIQNLGNSPVPTMAIGMTCISGRIINRYWSGEIDGVQCLREFSESGVGMLSSTVSNQIAGKITRKAVGKLVGSEIIKSASKVASGIATGLLGNVIGYALSHCCYDELKTALMEAKLAAEERKRIEEECEKVIVSLVEYRMGIELVIRNYFEDYISTFAEALGLIHGGYESGNVQDFIEGANRITKKCGGEALFDTTEEFDELMRSPEPIQL